MSAAQMSGPDHYRQAEMLLDVDWASDIAANAIAAAQAHATLALVAVTAELASHTAPPTVKTEYQPAEVPGQMGKTVDAPWKALLNPSTPDEENLDEPPF